jgi:choline dehydrogenase
METFWLAPKTDSSVSVDDQLWVLRMQSLRIIDASIMPTMPLANLNAGVLMIVENSADLMLETRPLLRLFQNRSRTIYLSRVKLGLGV